MNKWQQYLFSSTEMHQCHSKDDSDWSMQELSPTIILCQDKANFHIRYGGGGTDVRLRMIGEKFLISGNFLDLYMR
jgi:hypothetical protein